jgi:hypothetical protein
MGRTDEDGAGLAHELLVAASVQLTKDTIGAAVGPVC